MENIRFIYDVLGNGQAYSNLPSCTIGSQGKTIVDSHLWPIEQYGYSLGVNDLEIENALHLGTGFEDLLVVLLEPCGREWINSFEELVEEDGENTSTCVNDALKFAFKGRRDIYNTSVIDIRSFRPDHRRRKESVTERAENDSEAYTAFVDAVYLKQPKVVIVCQCDRDGIQNGMPKVFCSSVATSGKLFGGLVGDKNPATGDIENGHQMTIVKSFHPSYFRRAKDVPRSVQQARRELFRATFVVAANELAGRRVTGTGLNNLRSKALALENEADGLIDAFAALRTTD